MEGFCLFLPDHGGVFFPSPYQHDALSLLKEGPFFCPPSLSRKDVVQGASSHPRDLTLLRPTLSLHRYFPG